MVPVLKKLKVLILLNILPLPSWCKLRSVYTEIKHDFPFNNIRKVPREVLKTEGDARGFQHLPRDLVNTSGYIFVCKEKHIWSF